MNSVKLSSAEQKQLDRWLGAREWYLSRPPSVQRVLDTHPPGCMYALKGDPDHDSVYRIHSYTEEKDGSVRIKADRIHKATGVGAWRVFGLEPEELDPLPAWRDDESVVDYLRRVFGSCDPSLAEDFSERLRSRLDALRTFRHQHRN